jgi:hypothetical protein
LLTDGCEAYVRGAQALQLTHACCFAHVRRKLHEARKAQGQRASDSHAKIALQFIRDPYLIEKALWDRSQPISAEHRVQVCIELSAPIMARFHVWLEALAPQVLPQSLLGIAVHNTLGRCPKLTTLLTHGNVPLDNSRCENAIRPFVIGRKGWLFSDTVKGAIASAKLYSIVETAKANGVEPHAYLSLSFEGLPLCLAGRRLRSAAALERANSGHAMKSANRISAQQLSVAIRRVRSMSLPEKSALTDDIYI